MKLHTSILIASAAMLTSCSTLNESLELGATLGSLTSAAATYSAQASAGHTPSIENLALGAGVGLGIGLITAYITHRQVEADRDSYQTDQTEMHFGDLPPSPFIMPKPKSKKGEK